MQETLSTAQGIENMSNAGTLASKFGTDIANSDYEKMAQYEADKRNYSKVSQESSLKR